MSDCMSRVVAAIPPITAFPIDMCNHLLFFFLYTVHTLPFASNYDIIFNTRVLKRSTSDEYFDRVLKKLFEYFLNGWR